MVLNYPLDTCICTFLHCLNIALSMSGRRERVGYTFISWYAIFEHNTNQLIFMVLLLFFIYFWFHDLKKKKKINLTLKRLQMCRLKMFLYSNLVYFFLIIYVQHSSKLFYIKYHKIIHTSHEQLTSNIQKMEIQKLILQLYHCATPSTYFQLFFLFLKLFFYIF